MHAGFSARLVWTAQGRRPHGPPGDDTPMKTVLRAAVKAYQLGISPMMVPRCRFLPSCSDYALEAIERHGAAAGSVLTLRRLLRCHPWCEGGIDEVPRERPASIWRSSAYRHVSSSKSSLFAASDSRTANLESDR